ncbi:cytochrome b/b6 domain-containing protein [Phaeovibrio sulfidiphilus]|uniref:Cytochrome b/b6 domain-containing protein n=1 Tax=Phaeovibrio sulfidiphilus TaxID=1220600 RepID=A0A8J6YUG5_9PROT|nr:cytochrome b/b6 domain-containing protein [Phaeovibrio sulfidiphilus]MBE1236629.1 cytochrome b/b6 domain-containing protein [Phaeovibrio sulfidiphilus]
MSDSPSAPARVPVWDWPVRIFHWGIVVLLALLYLSGHSWGQENLHLTMAHHMFLGKLALTFIVFRVLWGFVGSDTARFANFLKGPSAVLAYLRHVKAGGAFTGLGHNPLGALMMVALMGLIGLTAITGLFTTDDIMTDGPFVHLVSAATAETLSWIHRNLFDVILILASVHIAAALFYKFVRKDDIITPMITGYESKVIPAKEPHFVSESTALNWFLACAVIVWVGIRLIAGA